MMDLMESVDEVQIRRVRMAREVEAAIRRTERLLASPKAADPNLRQTWERRLAAQQSNLIGLCR
jgi:hypothetical protein